ncbi:MAG: NAD-dependent epimerase/dehydratase family protein, partial [Miltoncostaeaceae bacterium]
MGSTGAALVTGGAGFIGSTLADALVAEGREVHVLDDLSTGHRRNVPADATLHRTDIRDAAAVAAAVVAARPSTVFHLAAQADVRRAIADPAFDADVNINGTLSVLEAARAVGARVVFAATGGGAYGEYQGLPLPTPESAEPRPMSHYGQSKLAGEGYCALYGRLYGVPTVRLRLGNVYGPRQDPHGEAGVVAIFSGRIIDGQEVTVFGDGLQTRDYVFVDDVVDAFLRAEAGPDDATLNVGTGREVSVLD